MNNIHVCSSRYRNSDSKMFSPVNFSITNYSTDAQSKSMKNALGDTLLLNDINNLHLIPDPLKKNLADSVISGTMEQRKEPDKFEKSPPKVESSTALGGITNFISGVFNVMSTMFQKRPPSPSTQYYDCFDALDDEQMSPSLAWHSAKFEVQNKNEQAPERHDDSDTMSVVNNCENKLNQVRLLLNGNNVQKYRSQRSKRVFVEPGSVEESFEDAFCPENIVRLANDTLIKCYASYNHEKEKLFETDAPIIKTEFFNESINVVKNLPESLNEYNSKSFQTNTDSKATNLDTTAESKEVNNCVVADEKHQVVSSCEDKINKIKELLQCKRRQSTNINKDETSTYPIPIKEAISPSCGNEIDSNSSETIKEHSFDEVTGKFYSSSADSDDSFQIVFTDRKRLSSDCESEDSFIVFEESPDSCYTSNDVFGSDSDSDMEDDSGYAMTCKLNHSLSRTFGDLTDDSLYSADVVDCAVRMGEETVVQPKRQECFETAGDSVETKDAETGRNSLLLDEKRKQEQQKQPPKKVRFSPHPPKVHVMRVWAFAARQARAGHWERDALDRERFRRRIADVDVAISWVLKPQHRSRVMFQRFMPWWNAQKRKEFAEKKAQENLRHETLKENSSNINLQCTESKENTDETVEKNCKVQKGADSKKDILTNNFVDEIKDNANPGKIEDVIDSTKDKEDTSELESDHIQQRHMSNGTQVVENETDVLRKVNEERKQKTDRMQEEKKIDVDDLNLIKEEQFKENQIEEDKIKTDDNSEKDDVLENNDFCDSSCAETNGDFLKLKKNRSSVNLDT